MTKKKQDKSHNVSVFYCHDINSGGIKWYGDTEAFFGLKPKKLACREDYLQLLNERDREVYNSNIQGFADEISCEYFIKKGSRKVYVKEVALKTSYRNKEYLQGVITLNAKKVKAKTPAKYSIASKSIITGRFDTTLLNNIKEAYNLGIKNKDNYILLILSIDNLPMIMSWQSNEAAERVLEDLEHKIKEILPENHYISQVGDEQFGIILRNQTNKEIDNIINKLSSFISLYKNDSLEDSLHLRLSIGSVHFPLGSEDEVDVVNKAYLALINVKGKDSDLYCDYEDAKKEHIDAQNEMTQLHYLQEAFNENRLVLAYQPIINSSTGETEYYESLLRISDGKGRYDSAGRFIPIAEKLGTVDLIDEYVLKAVVEELRENPGLNLCMNISNITTGNDNWLKMCSNVLQNEEISRRISIEITETAAQEDLRKTAYFTAAIQSLGCKVALDDFGVGYTSFRQLRSLSVDTVKIDGSYILGLEHNSENIIFIKSLVDFNKSYGLKTVAECVENGEVAKKLIDLGVELMQGYYFGKPEVNKPWLKKKIS